MTRIFFTCNSANNSSRLETNLIVSNTDKTRRSTALTNCQLPVANCSYCASNTTPTQTSRAEAQRRLSTSSLRKSLAMTALTMNVREAEAGATRLASPQERAVSRLKKPTDMQASASRNCFSPNTLPITTSRPRRARSSSRSPMRFMALESSTSPALEASTIMAMALQSSSDFMLSSGIGQRFFSGLSQRRATGDPTYATGDEQDSSPAHGRDVLSEEIFGEQSNDHVAHGRS